jgi:pSer/pThr/pTyr-binding forkhead associated (FHA) protein
MLLSSIEVISGPCAGLSFEPKTPLVSIGRSSDNTLPLSDAAIGEHHLQLHVGIDAVLLENTAVSFFRVFWAYPL